jgi:hypothetical protein
VEEIISTCKGNWVQHCASWRKRTSTFLLILLSSDIERNWEYSEAIYPIYMDFKKTSDVQHSHWVWCTHRNLVRQLQCIWMSL